MLIGHGYVQHAWHACNSMHCLRYSTYNVLNGVRLQDAVVFAYSANLGTVDAEGTITDNVFAPPDSTYGADEEGKKKFLKIFHVSRE